MAYPRLIVSEAMNRPASGKDTRTMGKDSVVEPKKPDVFANDPVTERVRDGARQILAKALEAEISLFIKNKGARPLLTRLNFSFCTLCTCPAV